MSRKKSGGGKSLREEIEAVIRRYREAVQILEETQNCDFMDVECMMKRVYAFNELNELLDRVFIYRSAFVASKNPDASMLKFYEDFILALKNAVRKYGVPVDESRWAKALADNARYIQRKLDGIKGGDVKKQDSNTMFI